MSSRADFTLSGLAGVLVVAAVVLVAWAARDSSAGSDTTPHTLERPPGRGLYSARSHRSPVTRTSIPKAQPGAPHAETAAETAVE